MPVMPHAPDSVYKNVMISDVKSCTHSVTLRGPDQTNSSALVKAKVNLILDFCERCFSAGPHFKCTVDAVTEMIRVQVLCELNASEPGKLLSATLLGWQQPPRA